MRVLLSMLVGALVMGHADASRAQSQPRSSHQSVFVDYGRLAHAAAEGGGDALSAFVASFLDRSIFAGVPDSVRHRIVAAELAYRHGHQDSVSNAAVADAVNRLSSDVASSGFLKTSSAQVDLLRRILLERVPDLGRLSSDLPDANVAMSPVEAVFVLTFLGTQKVLNPSYQSSPEAWIAATTERMARARPGPASRPTNGPVPPTIASRRLYREIVSASPSETEMAASRVLDELGFAK